MRSIIAVNPFRCRVWSLHDRLEGEINDETCKAEIDSFIQTGQLIPVLGRKVQGDPDYDIELIYGARRLFVARHLNQRLMVDVREVSDREALVAMDVENRLRKDISPYERGLSYAQWLRTGHFTSQEEIARVLDISPSRVSRLLRIARLPAVVVDAFRSPTDIRENWGLDLMDALDDPQRREATIRAARSLAHHSPRLIAPEVYRRLCAYSVRTSKPSEVKRNKIIVGEDGAPLFRIRYHHHSIAVIVPAKKVSNEDMARIEANIASILQKTGLPARRSAPILTPAVHAEVAAATL
jgi:ParB family chromosome partitioning protein